MTTFGLDTLPPPLPGFRAVPLDGAVLYFHRETGTHVRVATAATSGFKRAAPRVAMFGITNACNLSCNFCSRDRQRPSLWTVRTAADALRGLAEAGTLEVAFGGGEPFVFSGFRELLAELRARTPLALHVTTNGTLITSAMWSEFDQLLDMVRLSIYDEPTWHRAAGVLSDARHRWGANVLVDDAAVERLPEHLADLASRGCGDVSILTYVGAHPDRQLTTAGRSKLAAVLSASPLPARLSVCAGGSIAVPLLHHGDDERTDCGAGLDFVSITPDQGMLACSFQNGPVLPARTAIEILDGWRARHARMSDASPRIGCARRKPGAAAKERPPPTPAERISIWRSFSGNNSGECVMVASFETVADAERYLVELLPGWVAGAEASAAWSELFAREQVIVPRTEDMHHSGFECPKELIAIGRSVLATSYGLDDLFSPLRALAWKRGAGVVPGGVHVHDPLIVLAAIRYSSADEATEGEIACASETIPTRSWRHGDRLLITVVLRDVESDEFTPLADVKTMLTRLAGSRPLAAEIVYDEFDNDRMIAVLQRLGVELPIRGRLVATYWGHEANLLANGFARSLGTQPTTVAGGTVLVEPVERPKRLAVLGLRNGAHVSVLSGLKVALSAFLWFNQEPRKGMRAPVLAISENSVRAALNGHIANDQVAISGDPDQGRCNVDLRTADPAPVMTALAKHAEIIGCRFQVSLDEVDGLAWAVRRVFGDVREQ